MKRFIHAATVLAMTGSAGIANAADETRSCSFAFKRPAASGSASVTLKDGVVTRIDVSAIWRGLPGRPGYTCTIDSTRGDDESKWSDESGATIIANLSPFDPTRPDRVKITVGKQVSIDLGETQSLGRCGAGARLPDAIVIRVGEKACRAFLKAHE